MNQLKNEFFDEISNSQLKNEGNSNKKYCYDEFSMDNSRIKFAFHSLWTFDKFFKFMVVFMFNGYKNQLKTICIYF